MKKRILYLFLGLYCSLQIPAFAQQSTPRWSKEKAWQWYREHPWICGFNYIPGNAINYTAMWDKSSFSPKTIDQELALAQKTGFNTVRVVLQYLVWEEDPAYFKKTFDRFLTLCKKHHIKAMPSFFDDCVFGEETDPVLGAQREPREGWYAWAWSPSPGHSRVTDPSTHPMLEKYVKDLLHTFGKDERVLLWDLYNEPTNGGLGAKSLPLVKKVFAWARDADPVQPFSIGRWNDYAPLNELIYANSDVITFHNYDAPAGLKKNIALLKAQGRPMICTEWLNRPRGSTITDNLPIFYEEGIGCLHWGLVNGATQTDLPWGHRPGDPEPTIWQHDLYHPDFSPYAPAELALFKHYLKASKKK